MRKVTARILFAAALLCLFTLVACSADRTPESKTIDYFQKHRDEFYADAEDRSSETGLNVRCDFWDGEHPIKEYTVSGRGIAPSSVYRGVFYSYDGVPVSFQNSGIPLEQISDTEWEWREAGDNHGRVKLIEGNWFYFEASF